MGFLKFLFLLCLMVLGCSPLNAAPPEDYLGSASSNSKEQVSGAGNIPVERPPAAPKRITEDDLLYSHPSEENADFQGPLAIIKLDIQGRALPSRNGKVLVSLKQGEKVQIIKSSKDKRWVAIFVLKLRQKVWVPASTVVLAAKKP